MPDLTLSCLFLLQYQQIIITQGSSGVDAALTRCSLKKPQINRDKKLNSVVVPSPLMP